MAVREATLITDAQRPSGDVESITMAELIGEKGCGIFVDLSGLDNRHIVVFEVWASIDGWLTRKRVSSTTCPVPCLHDAGEFGGRPMSSAKLIFEFSEPNLAREIRSRVRVLGPAARWSCAGRRAPTADEISADWLARERARP